MYTLLNTLKLGLNSILIDQANQQDKKALENITTLDYMSGFVFRLYENLILEENDPKRFRLEIMVNRGAVVNPSVPLNTKEDHTIPISFENYIDINKQLTLNDIDDFFTNLLKIGGHPSSNFPSQLSELQNAFYMENVVNDPFFYE
mmetsp:Transcript_37895/g.36311  ORF Transcript_37895/g.36311 Transcript_37895/m.36311 type:complete len:146 (-) Transcript_37895:44-481(-)|eukprot:CAMPEP_0170555146 /NCGR_PEP_ID=MMETSP0211-20121228/13035_1 /TAXON_ID=311385 /ORGANISM="Pseudokeronopsis sp., Strain OXSARD2" /LENGTH=145 /DNA_ID=CAMNT_0010864765 /DNA_START=1531 /DNA_END=1968 /DNA_ORIENTATION=+